MEEYDGLTDASGRVRDTTTLPVDPNCRYAVFISYLEIYNEKIYDLLDDTRNVQVCVVLYHHTRKAEESDSDN